MVHTEIYFKSWCPYSQAALALLKRKNIPFEAIDLTDDDGALEQEMRARTGRSSVPQIFIDGYHVGGSDELHAAAANGELDQLLNRQVADAAA